MGSTFKTIGILVVLVGIIAAASYSLVKRTKPEEEKMGYPAILMCASPDCKKIFEGRRIVGQSPPFKCKYCQKMTAYRAVRCLNCDTIFPFVFREDPTKPESEELEVRCPECGYNKSDLVQSMDELKEAAPKEE